MRLLGSFLLAMPTEADTCRKLVLPKRRSVADPRIAARRRQASRRTQHPKAIPCDFPCPAGFSNPARSRQERAERLKKERKDSFEKCGPEAGPLLNELLEKYAEPGTTQFVIPSVLKVPPISEHGNVLQIASLFGGPAQPPGGG
jgi:type I restriction enzyme R subunit